VIALASLAARLWLAWHRPLWFDERFTIWASPLPLPRLLEILSRDSGPPLWYLIEKPLVLLGERLGSDAVARALSFLAALGLFAGASALPTRGAKSRYVFLAAASPLFLLYAAEARAYALLALECFALFLLATRGPESPRRLVGVALLAAAALYTHYLAIFAVVAVVVVAAAEKRARSAGAVLAGAAPFLAWVPTMIAQPHEAVAWMHEPPSELFTGILSSLGGAGDIPHPFGRPLPLPLQAAGIAIAVVIAFALARQWRGDAEVRAACAFLVFFFGGVLFASFLRPVAFAGRTEMAILPVWLWAAARAGDASRTVRLATVGAILVSAASTALLLAVPRPASPVERAMERLERDSRPGDVLFAGAHLYLPARLEADRGNLRIPVHAFPAEQALHPGWAVPRWPPPADLESVGRALDSAGPTGRVYFLVPPSYRAPLRQILTRRGTVRGIAQSPELLLAVWSSRSD
jgi:hypothetical protein